MNHYIPKEAEEAYDELMGLYAELHEMDEFGRTASIHAISRVSYLESVVRDKMQHIVSKDFKKTCKSHSDFYKRESEIIRLSMSKNFAYHTKRELEAVNITSVQSLLFKLLYTKKRE